MKILHAGDLVKLLGFPPIEFGHPGPRKMVGVVTEVGMHHSWVLMYEHHFRYANDALEVITKGNHD